MRIKQGIQALRIAVKQWRIAAIVYVLQFGLALTLGMQVRDVLKASIGNSLSVNKLTSGYDHTVLMDFLKTHGASITPLIGQLLWFIPVWIIFSVLINGGLLYCSTKPAEASGSVFWKAGAQYFFPFLKISLLHWGFLLVWTGVSLLPAILTLSAALQYFSSEQYAVLIVCSVAVVWLSGVGIILTASTSSRLRYMEEHTGSIGSTVKNGWKSVWSNKLKTLQLLLFFTGLNLVALTIYSHLESWMGMISPLLIAVFFLIQQAVGFFRIIIRQMWYIGVAMITK